MRPQFRDNDVEQFKALVHAAETLESLHGNWKAPYGEVYRMQRLSRVADLTDARFDDGAASLPCARRARADGRRVHRILFAERRRSRWSSRSGGATRMVGASYLAAWEFAPRRRPRRQPRAVRRQRRSAFAALLRPGAAAVASGG